MMEAGFQVGRLDVMSARVAEFRLPGFNESLREVNQRFNALKLTTNEGVALLGVQTLNEDYVSASPHTLTEQRRRSALPPHYCRCCSPIVCFDCTGAMPQHTVVFLTDSCTATECAHHANTSAQLVLIKP
jgi:hypothetical protein